jgi:hypothetical protein
MTTVNKKDSETICIFFLREGDGGDGSTVGKKGDGKGNVSHRAGRGEKMSQCCKIISQWN